MLYIENDHALYLVNLRSGDDYSFINGATVNANVLADPTDASPITGGGPVTLSYVDPSPDTVGGTTASPTVVASTSKMDLTVTVGSTTGLDLSAGRLLQVMHDTTIWKVRRDVAAAADASATIHLEPFYWTAAKPSKVKATAGEIVEIVDGTYKGTLDKAVSLEAGVTYYVKTEATAPGSVDGTWVEELEAVYR
jgi:hypothetical protein